MGGQEEEERRRRGEEESSDAWCVMAGVWVGKKECTCSRRNPTSRFNGAG